MQKFIVTTDSGCDLPIELLTERGIAVAKFSYEINGEIFYDTMVAEDFHDFYERMRKGAAPKTSQLTSLEFTEFFEPLLKEGLPILHVCVGSAVSGTYLNALNAAKTLKEKHPESNVYILDSALCSTGYGMLALKAAEMRDEGKTAEECFDYLQKRKLNVNTWYTTDELKYLKRSGRCSGASAVIGTLLKICPVLNLDAKGHLIVQERVRGLDKTLKRIRDIIEETAENPSESTLYVCHSDIPEKAKEFGEMLKTELGFKEVYYTYIGTIIGAHCGPGLMAAFYYGTPRDMKGYSEK